MVTSGTAPIDIWKTENKPNPKTPKVKSKIISLFFMQRKRRYSLNGHTRNIAAQRSQSQKYCTVVWCCCGRFKSLYGIWILEYGFEEINGQKEGCVHSQTNKGTSLTNYLKEN